MGLKTCAAVGVAVVMFSASIAVAQSRTLGPQKFSVFVTVPTRDGFANVNTTAVDVVAQLEKNISKARSLTVAKNRSDADVVLTLRTVDYKSYDAGEAFLPIGHAVVAVPRTGETIVVMTDVRVGDHVQPFGARAGKLKDAAKQISEDLSTWVNGNREALLERRSNESPSILSPTTTFAAGIDGR